MKLFSIVLFFAYSSIVMAATHVDRDTQLYNFILGKWHVVGGSCLSGSPVNWGGDPAQFFIEFEYLANMQWSITIKENGSVNRTSKGSYSLNEGNLYTRVTESCDHSSQIFSCESTSTPNSSSPVLLSIQGSELWILSNQGVLGGSCPPQDIFVSKLAR